MLNANVLLHLSSISLYIGHEAVAADRASKVINKYNFKYRSMYMHKLCNVFKCT